MKKIFSIFVAVLFAGSIFASEAQKLSTTVTLANGKFDAGVITWTAASDNLVFQQLQGVSTNAVNLANIASPRVYQGQIRSFEAKTGYVIDTVFITCAKDAKYSGGSMVAGTVVADNKVTANTTDLNARLYDKANAFDTIINNGGVAKFYLQTAKQLRFTALKVSYTKQASSEPAINAGNVEFGIYVPGVSAAKDVVVEGDNLSAAITATLKTGTSFAVEGTLTAVGGTLKVNVLATDDGEYEDELTLTSGTVEKKVKVSAKVVNTTGKGTNDDPFSIADVLKLANGLVGDQWVKGYILGGFTSSRKIDNAQEAIIALGDKMGEVTDTIAVQLPNGSDIRKDLGKNSAGWLVKIQGSLENYCSAPGLKSPNNYNIIEKPTAIEIITIEDEVVNKTIYKGQVVIIRNGVRYTLAGVELK